MGSIKKQVANYSIILENPTEADIKILGVKTKCKCTTTSQNGMVMHNSKETIQVEIDFQGKDAGEYIFNSVVLLKGYAPLAHQAHVNLLVD